MKILVTGFDPFGGAAVNPSAEALKMLEDEISGAEIIKLELPTVFRKSLKILVDEIKEKKPDIVICIGQNGGANRIMLERVAINIMDANIEDNEGYQPADEIIYSDGENAYFTNLPIKIMLKEMQDNGIPVGISNSAGTFVCNHLMYGLLYHIQKRFTGIRGGFIHIPYIPEQVVLQGGSASMSLHLIVKGLTCAIRSAITK